MKRRGDVAIIGAGAVGTGLALAIRAGGYRVSSVVSRTGPSARRLAARVGARIWGTDTSVIPASVSIVVIAVPDGEIRRVAKDLGHSVRVSRRARRVFHTSGVESSDLLRPLAGTGVTLCSIHPIFPFVSVRTRRRVTALPGGEWFGVEGRPQAVRWASSFVRSIGGRPVVIPKSKKTLYHVACTFASNYPLTILRAAEATARMARLDGGLRPLTSLLLTSLQNGLEHGPIASLTGPVVRGDARTLRRHRAELRKRDPSLARFFDALVAYTAAEAERAGRLARVSGRALTRGSKRTTRKDR